MRRKFKKSYPAFQDDIGDLHTVRPIPSPLIRIIDPFLFLNHHGPQVYPPNNSGLPFGPHPHRGFQTVTFILEGDIAHRDSGGHESVIGAGGVQWMSAGRGLVHEEVSSEEFKKTGGPLEILQLWVNLPAKHKMADPYYVGLQRGQIPLITKDDGRVQVQNIAGIFDGESGPFKPSTDIAVMTLDFKRNGHIRLSIPSERNIFFYVVRGRVDVNDTGVEAFHLAEFANDGDEIDIQGAASAFVLLCHAEPYKENVVYGGPFVMNSEDEIRQAYSDYRSGKF